MDRVDTMLKVGLGQLGKVSHLGQQYNETRSCSRTPLE
jgi:hypothetical protein